MLILSETDSANDAKNDEIQHRAWTRIGDTHFRVSHLQNQFALAEFAIEPEEAVRLFRRWLWQEMEHDRGVVWRELSELATAHEEGQAVEILVPQGAKHGAVIQRAVKWMVEHTRQRTMPKRHDVEPSSTAWDIEDGTLTTNAEIDAANMVWITGRMQSRIGVLRDGTDVLVPDYRHIPLQQARHTERVDPTRAEQPALQRIMADALDLTFEQEADASPVEYEPAPNGKPEDRFDTPEQRLGAGEDTERRVNALVQETEHWAAVNAVIKAVPDEEPRYEKRPPDNLIAAGEMVKAAYLHRGEASLLMVRDAEDQQAGKRFRHVTREEARDYQQTHRQPKQQAAPAVTVQGVAGENTLPHAVRERCRKTPYSAKSRGG